MNAEYIQEHELLNILGVKTSTFTASETFPKKIEVWLKSDVIKWVADNIDQIPDIDMQEIISSDDVCTTFKISQTTLVRWIKRRSLVPGNQKYGHLRTWTRKQIIGWFFDIPELLFSNKK